MRALTVAAALLFMAALAVGCTEQNAPTASDETLANLQLDFTNNPDNGNVRIFRGETHFVACWSDATNGLRACHGTLPLGGGTEPDCGLQEEGDPIEFQDVGIFNPDDPFSSWIHEVVKGEVFITVRDLNQPGDCFGAKLVAEGWGDFMYVDNDIFGIGPEGNNANAWKFQGRGALETPDGSSVEYKGHAHFRWNEQDLKVTSAKVDVR